ncbi:hypothetical protein Nepgr_024086 [Nepenthes gracilis]|uniref:Uncharacterized protein n=1 Tax=Nepenthes gracilis TaxID=150966 RepID=A0AAD3XYG3_NEPGR|nr:hypothetical protein Nepgr_024086 [Nepenthes gracilis]
MTARAQIWRPRSYPCQLERRFLCSSSGDGRSRSALCSSRAVARSACFARISSSQKKGNTIAQKERNKRTQPRTATSLYPSDDCRRPGVEDHVSLTFMLQIFDAVKA